MPDQPRLRSRLAPALFAVPLLLAAGCGGESGASSRPDPQLAAAGAQAYQSTCATCHGRDATGLPNLGKGLHMNEFVKTKGDAELVEFLKTGRPASHPLNTTGVDMPPKGGNPALSDQDMQAIVAYLRTLQ